MALPKKVKKNININPNQPQPYYPYGYDGLTTPNRRKELSELITEDGTFLPKGILHEDLDGGMLDFVKNSLNITIDGKKIPIIERILTIQRWAEFSQTWKFSTDDENVELPFVVVIRRPDVQYGSNPALNYTIPDRKQFHFAKVPTWNGVRKGVDVYTIPQPVPVDLTFDVKIVCNRMRELNTFNRRVMQEFTSRQAYTFVKGHYIPIVLMSVSDESVIEGEDRKYYMQNYTFQLQGFIIDEEEFEVKPAITRSLLFFETDITPVVDDRVSISKFNNEPTPPETCFPLSLLNTSGCLFDTITECPEDKRITIPDFRLVVNNSVEGFLPYISNLQIIAPGANFSSFTENCGGVSQLVLSVPEPPCFPINVVNSKGCLFEEITDCGDTCGGYTWRLSLRGGSSVSDIELLDCNGNVYKVEAGPFGGGTYEFCHGSETIQPNAVESGLSFWTQIGDGCSFVTLSDIELFDSTGTLGDFATPQRINIIGSDVLSATTSEDGCELNITVQGGTGCTDIIPNRIRPSLDTTIYVTGDLGWHWANGTYDYNDGAGIVQELDPAAGADYFFTLKHDNPFGTKFRFTDDQGVEAPNGKLGFPNDKTTPNSTGATPAYIIDNLTGLGYVRFPVATNRNWADAIDLCNNFTLGSYSNFRMIEESDHISLSGPNFTAPVNTTAAADIMFSWGFFAPRQFDTDTIALTQLMWLGKSRNATQAYRASSLGIANLAKTTTSGLGGYAVRTHF